jgi:hypothetical protein
MVAAMDSRRARTLLACALCIVGMVVATAAPSRAEASPASVLGGQTSLAVNLDTFIALINDGFTASALPPATLDWSTATVYFPIKSGTVFDVGQKTGVIGLKGGLRMTRGSTTVDTKNLTIKCDPVLGCSLFGTGLGVVPTEVAQLQNVTMKRKLGSITLTGSAVFREPTVTALNTIFGTTVFKDGMVLGYLTANVKSYP